MSTQGDVIPKDSPEVDKVLAEHGELGDNSGLGKRVPKLTEKGKQFSISNVKSLLKRLSKRLDQQITLTSPLIDSSWTRRKTKTNIQLPRCRWMK